MGLTFKMLADGQKRYSDFINNHPTIHTNRFPSWEELSQEERDDWCNGDLSRKYDNKNPSGFLFVNKKADDEALGRTYYYNMASEATYPWADWDSLSIEEKTKWCSMAEDDAASKREWLATVDRPFGTKPYVAHPGVPDVPQHNFGKCIPEYDLDFGPHEEELKKAFPYKYNEGATLAEAEEYIRSTYGQHYVGKGNTQANDIFLAQDEAECRGFWKNNAIKYLLRYGKKNGKDRKDLLKALHYTVFLLYLDSIYDDKGEKK